MNSAERARLIARYQEGPGALETAVAGIAPDELDFRPAAGDWTPREIIHHTADSEMTSAIRLRKVLAEDDPIIQGYDEAEFARRLHYDRRPIEASLAAIRGARESTASLLDVLTEEEWLREGTHSESGPYGVETWLEIYSAHCHDHAEQLSRVRAAYRQR